MRQKKWEYYHTMSYNPWRRINRPGFLCFSLISLFFFIAYLYDHQDPLTTKITFIFSSSTTTTTTKDDEFLVDEANEVRRDPCAGRYIYIQDLPTRFNEDVLKDCQSLTRPKDKTSMCDNVANNGFGSIIQNPDGFLSETGWYATNQFMLEVIFHTRMKKYKCLTNESSLASAIFVPFYAGLDLRRYLWRRDVTARDSSGIQLVKWLREKPEWKRMYGLDHFVVSGRISRDFRRNSDRNSDWGSKFMLLAGSRNLTFLTIEKLSSSGNEFGVPYPTYFHPLKGAEVVQWQERVRRINREFLFSFAGAGRSKHGKVCIRSEVIRQCQDHKSCNFLDCGLASNGCDDPVNVMKLFQSSVFCLQPQGDSFTRRSIFDSMLAGCVPVFFHPKSAYEQYVWHLPKDHTKYSVYMSGKELLRRNVSIEEMLKTIPEERVVEMREQVIRLIPRILYMHWERLESERVKDAFDIAVEGVLERVERLRRKQQEM